MITLYRPRWRSFLIATVSLVGASLILSAGIWASSRADSARDAAQINSNAMPIDLDRGASGLTRYLAAIRTRASMLMVTAHPDDEDGGMLAYETRGLGARGMLLTLNRGEGGQNAMSADLIAAMGPTVPPSLCPITPIFRALISFLEAR